MLRQQKIIDDIVQVTPDPSALTQDERQRLWNATKVIDSLIAQQSGVLQFDAEVHIEAPFAHARVLRARVVWRDPPRPLPAAGEQWRVILKLSPPQRPLNPGGFDMTRQWFGERLHAHAQVVPAAMTQRVAPAARSVLALRAEIASRIRDSIADRDAAALCAGLAVGATGDISREQWRIFSATGTTHLVAISDAEAARARAVALPCR